MRDELAPSQGCAGCGNIVDVAVHSDEDLFYPTLPSWSTARPTRSC